MMMIIMVVTLFLIRKTTLTVIVTKVELRIKMKTM